MSVPTYVLVVFLLHGALTRFTGRRFAIVVAVAALQVADARGDWAWQRVTTAGPLYVLGYQEPWRRLVDAHDAVFIVPSNSCVFGDDRSCLDFVSMEIQWLASESALPINGTYSQHARRRCSIDAAEWSTLEPRPGALDVVLLPAAVAADRLQARGAHCAVLDFGRVCTANDAVLAAAIDAGILRAAN